MVLLVEDVVVVVVVEGVAVEDGRKLVWSWLEIFKNVGLINLFKTLAVERLV